VSVAVFGGTNWHGVAREIQSDPAKPYSFTRTTGENRQWTATAHVSGNNIPANAALDPVVIAVMDDLIQTEATELNELTPQLPALEAEIAAASAAIEADRAAVEAKAEELTEELTQLRDEVDAVIAEVRVQAEEVNQIRDRIEDRREDVFRLGAQLEELRGDEFRIRQIQQQLIDLIQQLDGSIERAERRSRQLNP
jgi:chromosome segregation ATPase